MSVLRAHARAAALLAAFVFIPSAHAHVTLQVKEAPIDSGYKAIFSVPHGCKGSATTKIRIRIPEGVVGVKPQPKAGWSLETIKGDYAQPHMRYGTKVRSGVKEVIWTGGPLPDDYYDEFVFVGYLSGELTPNSTLYFPVVQECEQGVARWIDLPSADKKAPDDHSDSPAPGLKLLPKR
ncbi:YcnI family protein [Castellaniella hirudinis]|uniref:YcnI family protein n=1 Tax=Castellaniella hirudinis TaxID=1144617 RepID=A0ABV8RVG9_9BURK